MNISMTRKEKGLIAGDNPHWYNFLSGSLGNKSDKPNNKLELSHLE
jgi:hypothetical protein